MSRKFRETCPVCVADCEKQPDCRDCAGTGLMRNVPFAKDPWNQLVRNLWLGGHDYSPPGDDSWRGQLAPKIYSNMFETVISFYQLPHEEQSIPAEDVNHWYHRMPDGLLTPADLDRVHQMVDIAVDCLDRDKPVLIRCQAGLNRSSLCAGFVLQRIGFTAAQAIDLIRQKRSPYALCNEDFVEYLHGRIPSE